MINIYDFIAIPDNYTLKYDDEVLSIATDEFKNKLDVFLDKFSEIQLNEKPYKLPFHLFEKFPDVNIPELASEIFTRKQDLEILNNSFSNQLNTGGCVLEIGGWNGWLTNFFSLKGMNVITSDIFIDESNGLRSRKHYNKPNWLSVQTDLLDTSIYKTKFDLIVFNHCLQFLTDPLTLIDQYKLLLNKNGVLLIIGNTFFGSTSAKEIEVIKTDLYFKDNFDFNIRFYPSKAYFSYEDFDQFSKNRFKFISYKFSVPGRLKKFLKKEKSGILYFINL